MVDFFCVIPSPCVCAAVSVDHKCTRTCSFVEKTVSAVVERCDNPSTDLCLYMIGQTLCTVTACIA